LTFNETEKNDSVDTNIQQGSLAANETQMAENMAIHKGNEQKIAENRFVCHCGKVFESKTKFKYHKRTHDLNEDKLKCQECGKMFKEKSKRIRHENAVHRKITHKCLKCEKSFSDKSALNLHVKRKH
jgi:uncharacterized C2H2 Zn-finger protein